MLFRSKVSDHHAILPTKEAVVNLEALPTGEKNILMLVTARLLCAVWPEDYVSETTAVLVSCNGAEFTAKGHAELSAGWKAMERAFAASLKKRPDAGSGGELPEEKERDCRQVWQKGSVSRQRRPHYGKEPQAPRCGIRKGAFYQQWNVPEMRIWGMMRREKD